MPELADLDLTAILVATVAGFVLGGLWYSPVVLGSAWLRALGKQTDELGNPSAAMSATFISCLLSAFVMALAVATADASSALSGALVGLVLGVGLVAAAMLSDHLFGGGSLALFCIQAGYRVAQLVLMGALLGAFA